VAANNVPTGLVDFFHGLQVAIMMAVMTNIVQFAHWTVKRDKAKMSHCARFAPIYVLLVAAVLVCTQPVCMLVIGSWHFRNFFFDGGDFGATCTAAADCGSKLCLGSGFDCTTPDAIKSGMCKALSCAESVAGSCNCGLDSGALVPNTTTGWMIQIFGTYLGFILLFIGVFWATKLHTKIAKQWREIKEQMNGGSVNSVN